MNRYASQQESTNERIAQCTVMFTPRNGLPVVFENEHFERVEIYDMTLARGLLNRAASPRALLLFVRAENPAPLGGESS